MSSSYDLAVIGSGPGGYRAAVLGAQRGLKVAIIEQAEWGGCCLNRGCVPKKAWYAAAQLVARNTSHATLGVDGVLRADLTAAWRHQRRVVERTRASYLNYLARLGIELIRGHASFESADTLHIGAAQSIRAAHIIIATGATPLVPDGLPRIEGRVLTTDDLFTQAPPPGRRVAVLGSGAVATELSYILAMLGCEVRWIARRTPLAGRGFSPTALQALSAALRRSGLAPRLTEIVGTATEMANHLILRLADGGSETVDWVLLGTGRAPHTRNLGLDRCGIATDDRGFIAIDPCCATGATGVYAIGDVANAHMSANLALADAAVAVENIVAPGSAAREPERVPEVIYSALELARIGINADQAEARGLEPAIGFAAFDANPAALGEGDAEGYVRLVAELDRGDLLGAEIVGRNAGDTIPIVEQALHAEHPLRLLARANHNHPARAEEIQNAAQALASNWGMSRFVY